jgi:hypothetical protein
MQIRLRATAFIFIVAVVHSRTALGSSSITLVQGSLNATSGVINATVQSPFDCGALDLISGPRIAQPEVSSSEPSDDIGEVTVALDTGAASSLTLDATTSVLHNIAYGSAIADASLTSSLVAENTELSASREDDFTTADIVVPEFNVPEPAAWQGLIFGGAVMGTVLVRRARRVAV